MDKSEAARILNDRPVIGTTQCALCGATIPVRAGVPYPRRFCNARCRARARYRANKARCAEYQRAYRARRRQQRQP